MHHYTWKHALVLTAVSLFVPSLLCVEHWSMCRPFALTRQATWFPHISSLSFPCGQQCQPHSVAWEGCETSEVVWFGAEAWISSLSWLSLTPPHSSLKVFTSNLRSVSVHTQSSLYSNMVTQPSQAPLGTRPLLNCPLKPQRPGSPDAKHDPVMSYPSVCVCIIGEKWWLHVTMRCKLTVLVCKRSEGLQLTSVLKLADSVGTVSCEGVQLPFVEELTTSILQASCWRDNYMTCLACTALVYLWYVCAELLLRHNTDWTLNLWFGLVWKCVGEIQHDNYLQIQ